MIIFPTGFTAGVLFEPLLVWRLKNRNFWTPPPPNPNYLSGDFKDLLKKVYSIKSFNFISKDPVFGTKFFTNIFNVGIGTEEYLKDLVNYIFEMEYFPKIYRCLNNSLID
jgi:hypothetical protein